MIAGAVARALAKYGPLPSPELHGAVMVDLHQSVTPNELGAALHAMRREGYVRREYGRGGVHVPTSRAREIA